MICIDIIDIIYVTRSEPLNSSKVVLLHMFTIHQYADLEDFMGIPEAWKSDAHRLSGS